jgi:P27 family predicted phage terminase small subunit
VTADVLKTQSAKGVFDMSLSRKPPKHLRAAGKALWLAIIADYGVDDSAGLQLLSTACEALDRMRAAQCAIRKHGETVMDRYGCLKLNPACGLEKDSRAGMLLAIKALNLDLEPVKNLGRPGRATTLTQGSLSDAH